MKSKEKNLRPESQIAPKQGGVFWRVFFWQLPDTVGEVVGLVVGEVVGEVLGDDVGDTVGEVSISI